MSSIGQLPIELRVHPKEWDAGPAYERYPLSLMGHIMPKIYVPIVEVFALPKTIEAEVTIQNLTAGLEFAISQFPILSGVLEMDATTGRMWVARRRDSTVSLHVKYMLREGEFPSYTELAEKDFPPGSLTGSQLLPEVVTAKQLHSPLGDNNEDGIIVAAFQLNFIRGGLIIGLAIHHSVSDGPGCDGFLTTWAENTVAAAKGDPFIPAKQHFGIRGSPLDVESPTSDRMEELKSKLAVVKDAGGPMPLPPADFKMPSLVPQMWHFAKSKTELLKKKASSEGGSWISTYDAIMAVLWSSVTRAKLEMLHPNLESKATLVHAVDTRKVWEPPLPERFMGVGTSAARCEPLTVKDIIAPGNLPKLATAVRASITAMTPQYLSGLLQWIAGHEDQRWLEINVNSFLGMDFGGSSWQGMKVYETHDFGFGLPSAIRWPSPALEGFVLLYPSRTGTRDAKNDEGIEVCVCLEESCQKRLMEDQVLLEYAELRGL